MTNPQEPTPRRPRKPRKKTTKKDAVLRLLRRKDGASVADIMAKTGWQAHSVRGFLAGTVKKKLGLELEVTRGQGRPRRYAIRRAS